MNNTAETRAALIFASLAFLVTTAVYLLWPQYFYVGDDLQAAIAIQQAANGHYFYHPAGGRLYEPGLTERDTDPNTRLEINSRYLLEYPTSSLVSQTWQALGGDENVITPVLIFRGLIGGLGVLFVFLALYELNVTPLIAFIASLGLGFTATYWTYSTHLYQSINMITILALAFYMLVRKSKRGLKLGGKLLIAAILAFATLQNITGALSILPFAVAVALLHNDQTWASRIKQFILFGVLWAAVIAATILVAMLIAPGSGSMNPLSWGSGSIAADTQFGVQIFQDAFRAALGIAKSQVIFPGGPGSLGSLQAFWDSGDTRSHIALLAFYGVILVIFALPIVLTFWQRRQLPANQRWVWITLATWFGVYCLFNWYWEPAAVKFWLIPLLCWWLATGLILNHLRQQHLRSYRPAAALITALVAISFILNFTGQFLPESRKDDDTWLSVAESLRDTDSNALFISDGHPLEFYIAYFSRLDILSTQLILDSTGSADTLMSILNEHIRRHRDDGGNVYLFSSNPERLPLLAQAVGLSGDQELETAWEFPHLTIYKANFPTSQN